MSTPPDGPDEVEYRQTPYAPPPGATQLLLVRHGASEPARADTTFPLVDGHGDPELAPEGREQAEAVAARLALQRIDAIWTSGLRRTDQTAAPLAARLGLTPQVETGLREVRLGEWEGGLFRRKVAEGGPLVQRLWAEERWEVVPGGEDSEAFAERVRAAIDRLVAAHPGGRIAVFAHGAVIGQVMALAAGGRWFAFIGADNCSISQLVVVDGRWLPRVFNDTAHLEPTFGARTAPPA